MLDATASGWARSEQRSSCGAARPDRLALADAAGAASDFPAAFGQFGCRDRGPGGSPPFVLESTIACGQPWSESSNGRARRALGVGLAGGADARRLRVPEAVKRKMQATRPLTPR